MNLALKQPWRVTLLVVGVVTLLRVLFLFWFPHDLYADEAQYWLWSQVVDWGYYSKPPVVAWAIALSSAVCGEGEGCIKLASPLAYMGASLLLYGLTRRWWNARVAAWVAVMFVTLPGVGLSAGIISTDPFLLLFWVATLYAFQRALEDNGWHWWVAMGLAAGLGLLSKYNAAFLALGGLALLWWRADLREIWKNPRLYLAIGIALALFAPNLWWNAQHGWVSWKHTGDITQLEEDGVGYFNPLQLGEFAAAQLLLLGPVLGVAALWMMWRWRQWWGHGEMRFLAAFAVPVLGVIALLAVTTRAHGNWAAPMVMSVVPMAVWWLLHHGKVRWLWVALSLHLFIQVGFVAFDPLVAASGVPLSRKTDPFYRVRGWERVGGGLSQVAERYPGLTWLTDRRKVSAQLVYYIRPHPFDLVQFNLHPGVKDFFQMTTRVEADKPYLLAVPEPAPEGLLANFRDVEKLAVVRAPLYDRLDGPELAMEVYRVQGVLYLLRP